MSASGSLGEPRLNPRYPLALRTRPAILWRVSVLSMTLGASIANVWRWLEGQSLGTPPTVAIMLLAALSVCVIYLVTPARAGPGGLLWFDAWGLRRAVAWGEVQAVDLARWWQLLWVPALRLRTADGRVRWLPRDSLNLAELHALARAQAGAAHPLVRVLETPLHRL